MTSVAIEKIRVPPEKFPEGRGDIMCTDDTLEDDTNLSIPLLVLHTLTVA